MQKSTLQSGKEPWRKFPAARSPLLLLIFLLGPFGFPACLAAQISITIPQKGTGSVPTAPTQFQIATAKLNFSLESNAGTTITGATLHFVDPEKNPFDVVISGTNFTATASGVPGFSASGTGSITFDDPYPLPSGAKVHDNVTVLRPDPTNDSDNYKRFEVDISLKSNYFPQTCASTQVLNPDVYQITVTPAPNTSAVRISGTCLESYDHRNLLAGLSTCLADPQTFVPPGSSSDKAAGLTVNGSAQSLACYKARPGLDAVLVLDKSGSMSTTDPTIDPGLCPSSAPCTRMAALHKAVRDFITMWKALPESSAIPPPAADQLGIVVFDSQACFWQPLYSGTVSCPQVGSPPALVGLASVGTAIFDEANLVATMSPGSSTSIGAGLIAANPLLPTSGEPGRREVVLLMSDGQQNTEPIVDGGPGPVTTTPGGALTNQPKMYTVTVGPSLGVDAAIHTALANHTLGFYLNTEDTPRLLSPFFLELLQNVLKFNSYETVRMISQTTSAASPFSATVPISTTGHDVEFSLMWPSNFGPLRLTITPPGGGQSLVKDSASGFISIVQTLPVLGPFDPRGNWGILVEAISPDETPTAISTNRGDIPFDLHIMTDDGAIKSDLSIGPADYKPGDKIRLRAKLTQFGRPIVGLGSKSGDRIEAELVRPGTSIGDLLSDSDASATPQSCPSTGPCDRQSPAEAKLANMLKDPNALDREKALPNIPLFDDGNKAEHGDDVAGDGIYSALYSADLPGHYNFLIAVERVDSSGPRFSRQQLRTAYVRPFPDGGKTNIQATIIAKGTLQIVMTPRGVSRDRLGPGWANYFWFTAPGVTPFKANDNLDGSYTATLNFTGKPPKVSVHFENVLAVIGDSVTANNLPQPPDSSNVLINNIPILSKWAAFLDLGGAFPHGAFSSAFNPGFSFNAGLEYMANSHFSAEGIFGYHHFSGKFSGDLSAYQFSGNAKVYLVPPQKFRPFVNGGIGAYKFSPGSGNFGGNFGGGVLYELTLRFGLQGSYNFHAVNTSGGATKFSTIQGGIRYVF